MKATWAPATCLAGFLLQLLTHIHEFQHHVTEDIFLWQENLWEMALAPTHIAPYKIHFKLGNILGLVKSFPSNQSLHIWSLTIS